MAEPTGENAPQAEQIKDPNLAPPMKMVPGRSDYLKWEDYYMAVASLAAQRSKDPSTQVGACIVDGEKRIVGIGYNGMPTGEDNDSVNWGRDDPELLDTKHGTVVHAEVNAIAYKTGEVKGGIMYTTLHPCNECAKFIIQSGIKKVWYLSDKYNTRPAMKKSKEMLDKVKVEIEQFKPVRQEPIEIDLDVKRKEAKEELKKARKRVEEGFNFGFC